MSAPLRRPQAFYGAVAAISRPVWASNAQQSSGGANNYSSPFSAPRGLLASPQDLRFCGQQHDRHRTRRGCRQFHRPTAPPHCTRFPCPRRSKPRKAGPGRASQYPADCHCPANPPERTPLAISREELIAGTRKKVTGIGSHDREIFIDDLDVDSLWMVEITV